MSSRARMKPRIIRCSTGFDEPYLSYVLPVGVSAGGVSCVVMLVVPVPPVSSPAR